MCNLGSNSKATEVNYIFFKKSIPLCSYDISLPKRCGGSSTRLNTLSPLSGWNSFTLWNNYSFSPLFAFAIPFLCVVRLLFGKWKKSEAWCYYFCTTMSARYRHGVKKMSVAFLSFFMWSPCSGAAEVVPNSIGKVWRLEWVWWPANMA